MSIPISIRNLVLATLAFVVVFAAPIEGQSDSIQLMDASNATYVQGSEIQRQEPTPTPPVGDYLSMVMADLAEWQLEGYSIQVPSTWEPPEVQLEDRDYWIYYAAVFGDEVTATQRNYLEQLVAAVQSGECDLVLMDPLGEGKLILLTLPYALESVSQLQDNYSAYATDSLGANILASEVISLPAGDSLHETIGAGTSEFDQVSDMVMIPNEETLIVVEVDTPYYASFQYEGVAEAIAETIVFD